MQECLNAQQGVATALVAAPTISDTMAARGIYQIECYDSDGNLRWSDAAPNVVTTVGKNLILDKSLAGSSWSTGTIYMGLKGTGSVIAGDTMTSHGTWTALNITSARISVALSASSNGTIATSATSDHTITAAGPTTVAGVYLVVGGTSTNTDTTGTLLSAGDFSGGSRTVYANDILKCTYSLSI